MKTHYHCSVISRTGQPMEQTLFQPDFWNEHCFFWGWPIDAPNTLNKGGLTDNTPAFAYGWTQDIDFVMRPGT
jgi:hypothetical protein